MGSTSGGGGGGGAPAKKSKYLSFRNRQRANMSFFIVVMFFAVFGIIVFTEIFFIDEKTKAAGLLLARQHKNSDEYEDKIYISIRFGQDIPGLPEIAHEFGNFGYSRTKTFVESQLPPYPENLTLSDGSWQAVEGTRYKYFVFAAYYDQRSNQKNVRIIAATKTRGPEKVWCRLWYRATDGNSTVPGNFSITVRAETRAIRENWNLRYSACFVMCPISGNMSVPTAVSVVPIPELTPSNLLKVVNNFNDSLAKLPNSVSKLAVCVKPLHFDYNKELLIMEFIELNRLMGVEHFTFYNNTIGPQVSCILDDYRKRGLVTLLPWKLPMASQKEIRTEGLFAALNDCLYRSMYKFSHTMLIDLDEYVIPNYNDTIPQLIEYLNHRLNTRNTGSFSFQNAFFYLQWDDDVQVEDFTDLISSNMVTLKKTRRKSKLHPHKQRSKYICRPELVVEAGNHFVWEFIPGHGTLNVPADAAILHHYRICEFGGNDCIKTSSFVDRTAYRYLEALTKAVRQRYDFLKYKCGLTEPRESASKVFHKLFRMLKTGAQR